MTTGRRQILAVASRHLAPWVLVEGLQKDATWDGPRCSRQGRAWPWLNILGNIPWYGWVAIVAIVCAALQAVVKSIHHHEQRMAMIKQGMDPSSISDKDDD